ncbi:MarR family winged helix-turn-helix transcriptional regulator [Bacillus testis]|uniref:MarR family winged helix-turn-helix transcriptional regulator n=1 Tax=Bacillus testis TaxID=1622072 RepID=UPI00067EB012|nr:MarR family transcriptional regulator [Bacillus testis]
MSNSDIFKLIHTVELFTNEALIKWSKSFQYSIGISPILVLSELHHNGSLKQSVLANKLGYTPASITNIANKLIKNGLAIREYNEEDRRNVFLTITDQGEMVLKKAHEKGTELRRHLFEALTEEEVHQFLAIHEKLLKHLEE